MKQAKFTLNNKELLLVELPDIEDCDPVLVNESELFINGVYHALPFRVKLIGKLSEVTEEQYKTIVAKNYWDMGTGGYIDYASDDPTDSFVFAKESFFSKLASENIHFSNPINEPEFMRGEYNGGYDEDWVREWQSAQEKVFNIDNTYLFEKV